MIFEDRFLLNTRICFSQGSLFVFCFSGPFKQLLQLKHFSGSSGCLQDIDQNYSFLQGSLCLLDIDNNIIELPEEIPDLPGRNDLIDELQKLVTKFNIIPRKGSVFLRPGSAKGDLEKSSSFESVESDLEGSYEKEGSRTLPRRSSSFKGKSRGRTTNNDRRRERQRSSSVSPVLTRKVFSSELSQKMQPRKISCFDQRELSKAKLGQDELLNGQLDPETGESSKLKGTKNEQTSFGDGKSPKHDNRKLLNPRLAAMMAIAEKAGIDPSAVLKKGKKGMKLNKSTEVKKEDSYVFGERALQITRTQQHENEFNVAVREIFVNRFTQMLVDYESFVILPKQNKEQWISNREYMHNFDKAAFLSDQSASTLPFMTLFVETQGFASLIDMKIMALWEDSDPRLSYFDKRVDKLKVRLGIIRAAVYEKCTTIQNAGMNFLLVHWHLQITFVRLMNELTLFCPIDVLRTLSTIDQSLMLSQHSNKATSV